MTAQITSWGDLTFFSEEALSESKTPGLNHTSFGIFDDNTQTLYYGEIPSPRTEISIDQLNAALHRVPDASIYLPWPISGANLRKAPEELLTGTGKYVKLSDPSWMRYRYLKKNGMENQMFSSLIAEAETLEELSRHPHPNIIRYHGCRVTREYFTGLVLDEHPRDLETHFQDELTIPNQEAFMASLESAIQHLHGLGWAHNDITPSNILVSEAEEPILIDFEGCQKLGTELKHIRGTKGWIEGDIGDHNTSEAKHDIYALGKIRDWLKVSCEVLTVDCESD